MLQTKQFNDYRKFHKPFSKGIVNEDRINPQFMSYHFVKLCAYVLHYMEFQERQRLTRDCRIWGTQWTDILPETLSPKPEFGAGYRKIQGAVIKSPGAVGHGFTDTTVRL